MTAPPEAARALAPRAAELAAQAEAERRLPAELSAELAAAGLYRLCVPAALGGGEAPPAELLEAVEALATGDGAAGWCVAVCATAGMLGRVPRARGGPRRSGASLPASSAACSRPMGARGRRGRRAERRRALALLQQRRELRLAHGRLRRRRRRGTAPARERAPGHPARADARRRGRGDRHLDGVRPARDRQPRHRGRGARRARRPGRPR